MQNPQTNTMRSVLFPEVNMKSQKTGELSDVINTTPSQTRYKKRKPTQCGMYRGCVFFEIFSRQRRCGIIVKWGIQAGTTPTGQNLTDYVVTWIRSLEFGVRVCGEYNLWNGGKTLVSVSRQAKIGCLVIDTKSMLVATVAVKLGSGRTPWIE